MVVVDLCQSSYHHIPMVEFGEKDFYKKHSTKDVVCSDCLKRWVDDCSRILAREILRKAIPIYQAKDAIYKNPNYPDPNAPKLPDDNDTCAGNCWGPDGDPSKCHCWGPTGEPEPDEVSPYMLNPGVLVEVEKPNLEKPKPGHDHHDHKGHHHHHPDYEIPDKEEKYEDPWVPNPDLVKPEDLTIPKESYYWNEYFTSMTVSLPEYMKYILCSNAEIEITARHGGAFTNVCNAKVIFNGACPRPVSHGTVGGSTNSCGCGCSSSEQDEWKPISDFIKPKTPVHTFTLEIHPHDIAYPGQLEKRIRKFMDLCITTSFDLIPDRIVKIMMKDALHNKYSSTTKPAGCPTWTCSKCGKITSGFIEDYYVYRKSLYCLRCMYDIVVKLAVDANLAEAVGLATGKDTSEYSVEKLYRDTDDWKRIVIGRYINAMKAAGGNPEIKYMQANPFTI